MNLKSVCEIHEGEYYEPDTFPSPCAECKKLDGHGQKARVIQPGEQKEDKNGLFSLMLKRFRRLL